MIRKFPGHNTEHPPGQVTYNHPPDRQCGCAACLPSFAPYLEVKTIADYVAQVQKEEARECQHCDPKGRCTWTCETEAYKAMEKARRGLTNTPESCYTITTGMSLRDFKDGIGQAYWNRDRETLDRLLESLQNAN